MLLSLMNLQASNGFIFEAVILMKTESLFVSAGHGSMYIFLNLRAQNVPQMMMTVEAPARRTGMRKSGMAGRLNCLDLLKFTFAASIRIVC